MSYYYLKDPECRRSIEDCTEDSILIFDEAHHIVKVLQEASSWNLNPNYPTSYSKTW